MKIYYNNEWITVEQDDERLEKLNIFIGSGAIIGSDARIESGVIIESGAIIESDAIIYSGAIIESDAIIGSDAIIYSGARIESDAIIGSIIFNNHNKFRIIICNKLLWIGCEGHTPKHWLKNYKEIAEKNNISADEMRWYLDFYKTKLKNLF